MSDIKSVLEEVSGISPTALLSVGTGYVREEVKSIFFRNNKSISAEAIVNSKQLCQLLSPKKNAEEKVILGDGAGVELLRRIFKSEQVRIGLPSLSEQRFRPRFYEKLFLSLQQGRKFFAHAAEAEVLSARLEDLLGKNQKRNEFFKLNEAWEQILTASDLWDEGRLLEEATSQLEQCDSEDLPFKKVYTLEHFVLSPRLRYFWNELSKKTEVIPIERIELRSEIPLEMVEAHSLEDAAFFLFDELSRSPIEKQALVIQDVPKIRRVVRRMAKLYGIPFFDPRDPMALTLSEEIKVALLEFEMVSKNFPGDLVCQWINVRLADQFRVMIQEYGIVNGLSSYATEKLKPVHGALSALEQKWPKRISLKKLSEIFISTQSEQVFWERFFEDWIKDLSQVGMHEHKRPLRIWFEQLKEKLKTARPPSESARIKGGLALYRVDQAVSFKVEPDHRVHFFGVGADFFEAKEWTNDWFTQREVEVLSKEFGLPSKKELITEREQSFLAWANASESIPAKLWNYEYDESGTEMDSLELSLSTLQSLKITNLPALEAHPKLISSWTSELKLIPDQLILKSALKPEKAYSMSFLDDYSECPFVAYASHVIKGFDEREPDFEFKGDAFGQLMHLALEKLIRNKLTPEQAFDSAWEISKKKCWFKSDRILASVKHRALALLNQFEIEEAAYRVRSNAEPYKMEDDLNLELKRDGFSFSGRADRIDQHNEGLIVFDYKTQSTLTPGRKILEQGKSLQLALYGLALKDRFNQEVVGAQFIQLVKGKKVNRNAGIVFKKWNGKKAPNAITLAGGTSHSILDLEPDAAWAQINAQVLSKVKQLETGDFSAKPVDPADCESCRYRLSCGWIRRNRSGDTLTQDDS